ncbi:DUF2971 domain-containing protein [Acinetobacter sp. ANC 4178]|uniref:DUF2971 domain-containing protein n=1 Tax=Acinetobacter sp. ANC 4178 TaxID=2529839 RepID=UPI001038E89C|nr:DUF2971 domain-containing protein [Acinetobacter sp. ANC 4178]TCB65029.1 DUF2971 domain-containing protein [Acinetobacter sp. ANC 4178]
MYIKYLTRTDFLDNGYFRITQPQYLNDPNGEAKFTPFFNRFSDADLKYAYKLYLSSIFYEGSNISDEFLIQNYLLPTGDPYSIDTFHSLKAFKEFENFETMDGFDRFHATEFIKQINSNLRTKLDQSIGIFSLTNSFTNQEMWLKYSNHGKGIAISFDSKHDFFIKNPPQKITYDNNKKASITFFESMIRINGLLIPNNLKNPHEILKYYHDNLDPIDLYERLLLTKAERWSNEEESRIIFDLNDRDNQKDNKGELIALKKIPFECFSELVFGWDTSEDEINKILGQIEKNPALKHLQLRQVEYGYLEEFDNLRVREFNKKSA